MILKLLISRKKKCGSEDEIAEIIETKVEIKCEYCNKTYSLKKNLIRHQKDSCKAKLQILQKKLNEAEDKIKELESIKPTTIINDNSTTNNTVNNNIIINITPYNDPNLEGAQRYYKEAIKKIFMSVPTIIERIHFNTDLPENHNICITNYRSKLAKVFNGREWKTMDEDHLIDELVNTYEGLLEDWAEDKPERMKYIEKYKEIKLRDGAEKVNKDLKDEVKKLIYDKRSMIKIKN